MHALFFMSDSLELDGVENPSIHIFETEEAADQWLLEKLIAADIVDVGIDDDVYIYADTDYATVEELLESVRDDIGGDGEYCHVYPAVDHR